MRERSSTPLKASARFFARIAAESGIRRFHAHLLRHTWATNWMKHPGADLLTLMRQGGWKRLQMVEAKIVSFSGAAKVI
jgi:integrase